LTDPTPEAAALRREVRAFLADALARGAFRPRCDPWVTSHSPAFSAELGARGWIGLNWPSRYGGRDRPEHERYVITEELLAAGAPVAAHWVAHRQSGPLLLRHGTEEQRRRFLPEIASGRCYFSICMSEPNAGSDLASVRTSGTQVAGGWRLNGRKVWTSHAHRSHFAILLARTSQRAEDRHAGLSQFILDLRAPGLTIQPVRLLSGEAHFTEVLIEDVFVPDELVVGEIGNGWAQVVAELGLERSGPERFLSTMPLLRAFVASLAGSSEAHASVVLGRLTSELWTLRHMSLGLVDALQRGAPIEDGAALVKDLGTTFEQRSVEAIRELMDRELDRAAGDGLASLLAEATLAAPSSTLRGGTTEVLRGIVAKRLTS